MGWTRRYRLTRTLKVRVRGRRLRCACVLRQAQDDTVGVLTRPRCYGEAEGEAEAAGDGEGVGVLPGGSVAPYMASSQTCARRTAILGTLNENWTVWLCGEVHLP